MTVQSTLPSVPSPAAQQPISWLQRWQAQSYFFRPVAFFTILIGVCLHLSRLLLGDAITFHTIVTPTFDQYFAFPIAYAGISGLFSWRRMAFRGRGHQFFLGFIVFYMVASIPIHLSAWFTHSIEHLKQFPLWFSVLLQPYYAAVLMALWRLQFKVSTKSSTNSAALKGAQPMTPHLLTSTPSGLRNALLHQRVLRVHGVMLLMVSLAAAVNATVARYLGLGPYAFLQQNPMAWIGLIQAYLLMVLVAVTLLIGERQSQPRTWHLIGVAAHMAPLLAVISSWTLLASLGFGPIASGSLAFHAIWIVIETIMVFVPTQDK